MLCDAVIPNRDGIVTPTQSNLIFGSLYLLKKVLQDLVTLPLIQIQNVSGERLINVEVFPPGYRAGLCNAEPTSLRDCS